MNQQNKSSRNNSKASIDDLKALLTDYLTDKGIESIGKTVVCMAENEQLEAHANAMRLRMKH